MLAQHAGRSVERRRVDAALTGCRGDRVSVRGQFLLVRVPDAAGWHARLRSAGILVKSFHGAHPALANCLRITIGTPAENDALIDAMGAIR
jgi:histidinol-phosphate aminotransferase